MCGPAAVMAGAALAGAAIKAYSDHQAGNYNAAVDRNNVKIAEWQRAEALQAGAREASAIRAQGAQYGAQATTGLAASGIDTTVGSAGNIFAAIAANTEMDAETAKANAARQAWGMQQESRDLRAKATMTQRQTALGGVGTTIGGIGQAMSYYR